MLPFPFKKIDSYLEKYKFARRFEGLRLDQISYLKFKCDLKLVQFFFIHPVYISSPPKDYVAESLESENIDFQAYWTLWFDLSVTVTNSHLVELTS